MLQVSILSLKDKRILYIFKKITQTKDCNKTQSRLVEAYKECRVSHKT